MGLRPSREIGEKSCNFCRYVDSFTCTPRILGVDDFAWQLLTALLSLLPQLREESAGSVSFQTRSLTEAERGSPPEKLSRTHLRVHEPRPRSCVGWI